MSSVRFPFDNTYVRLPERFHSPVRVAKVPQPELLAFNYDLAKELKLPVECLSRDQLAQIFSGNEIPAGAEPIALAYAGHQFGYFNPQLGDGRAVLLGEVVSQSGLRFDLQLKGSGATAFSRRGDGKSALGPVLREYIVSEAMFHLGVPTTRALAAVATGEEVFRETALPGGVFTRVASSHLRIGSFEYFASREDLEGLKILLEYAVERHYPQVSAAHENLALAFLRQVITATASLVTDWMSIGFIHGVMNTDNSSVAGITLDFGPCAFMDFYNPAQVYSSIDRNGRYAYNQQPSIAHWNLNRLAEALLPLIDQESDRAISLAEEELHKFSQQFNQFYLKKMTAKIGIHQPVESDSELLTLWLAYLQRENLDYTLSFRALAAWLLGAKDELKATTEFSKFTESWLKRLEEQALDLTQVAARMNQVNPVFIPRNHQIENAIAQALDGEYTVFEELCEVLASPYQEQEGKESYRRPPLEHEIVQATFCGT